MKIRDFDQYFALSRQRYKIRPYIHITRNVTCEVRQGGVCLTSSDLISAFFFSAYANDILKNMLVKFCVSK